MTTAGKGATKLWCPKIADAIPDSKNPSHRGGVHIASCRCYEARLAPGDDEKTEGFVGVRDDAIEQPGPGGDAEHGGRNHGKRPETATVGGFCLVSQLAHRLR